MTIKFGTDGWRGIIAEDFTFANVRKVANAIARYVIRAEQPERGVIIGYDTRFALRQFRARRRRNISAAGTPVWLADRALARLPLFLCWSAIAAPRAESRSPPATIRIAGTESSSRQATAAPRLPPSSPKSKTN